MNATESARGALRAATAGHHECVDRVFSQATLGDGASYGRFLTAQAAAHLCVEDALERDGIAGMVPDWPARTRRALILDDLAVLGIDPPAPAGNPRFDGEAEALGALYVLEGSRLGGTLLRRSVPDALPSRYLGSADSALWRNLLVLLDDRLDSDLKRAAAIRAARAVFALFEAAGRRHLGTADIGG